MTLETLEPQLAHLVKEYVLVQAWKKTVAHIRAHNWYADTLELDSTAVNLPGFLSELAGRLSKPLEWQSEPLRIVPAPKAQEWQVTKDGSWEPVDKRITAAKLRPLAQVCLADQVAATAVMMCLADRVETLQGDPRAPVSERSNRRDVISYGNRLFCDRINHSLYHRWGSAKLYRGYFQDYRKFLERPELVAEGLPVEADARIVVVHSDLLQFYDRVGPALLNAKIARLVHPGDDPAFFRFAERLLGWRWSPKDAREVAEYSAQAELPDFSVVALPQGLVAGGFFSNVSLLDFDDALRMSLGTDLQPGVRLEDASRYVDDLRLVMVVSRDKSLSDVEELAQGWLQGLLDQTAVGLRASPEKTKAAAFREDERPIVRQSRKMARVQSAVSGGFDAKQGEEILEAVQGLVRAQQRYAAGRLGDVGWTLAPIADVRDSTVARFAAARFRTTYRSLRPLLAGMGEDLDPVASIKSHGSERYRTQSDLDDDARAFALGLIEQWIHDPSNVRLLRIGLDLWPAEDVLKSVLGLLRPLTESGGRRKAPRRVAWYCLSEVLRAGATETGFVEDHESLPREVDIEKYRRLLRDEAVRVAAQPAKTLPWYLRQQALLYLATSDPSAAPFSRNGTSPETKHYRELILFLRGEGHRVKGADFATLSILARRSFLSRERADQVVSDGLTVRKLEQIADRDPSYALELLAQRPGWSEELSARTRDDLCVGSHRPTQRHASLADWVLPQRPDSPLRDELVILSFASKFIVALGATDHEAIRPSDVVVQWLDGVGRPTIDEVRVSASRVGSDASMYRLPAWCSQSERWRFHLGYLLRFILAARPDFTQNVRAPSWKEGTATYRVPGSHWLQRRYGYFSGREAFGDEWLAITDWTENLLSALLAWPGCRPSSLTDAVKGGVVEVQALIERRIALLRGKSDLARGLLMLPLPAPWPRRPEAQRPLRACIVQTVIPAPADFVVAASNNDLTFSSVGSRARHRNHLASALAAVDRMLDLRETHRGRDGRLDWLIFPELSVHPRDVRTHLIPFARVHKTIVLAGLTYESPFPGQPLVNSALWIIPEWSSARGLQMRMTRQGKHHLAPEEVKLNEHGAVLQGFRPCQWLVGYEWSSDAHAERLWLSAAICYDATDLSLANALRDESDVFAIPALNQDVNTFDQMALALHYHMYQMVIVANNGTFGGSNAYAPYKDAFRRQVFHVHGQPQASVSFLEIDNIPQFLSRREEALSAAAATSSGDAGVPRVWKYPPAGSGSL